MSKLHCNWLFFIEHHSPAINRKQHCDYILIEAVFNGISKIWLNLIRFLDTSTLNTSVFNNTFMTGEKFDIFFKYYFFTLCIWRKTDSLRRKCGNFIEIPSKSYIPIKKSFISENPIHAMKNPLKWQFKQNLC